MDVDALIVGGGPVGLALAVGLQARNLKVKVLEKSSVATSDWSGIYTYRLDSRGRAAFKQLGLLGRLEEIGVPSHGFDRIDWEPDGRCIEKPSFAAISLGYWIQRPALLDILTNALAPDTVLDGLVENIKFDDGIASLAVRMQGHSEATTTTIRSKFVFGCDGVRSVVRTALAEQSSELEKDFTSNVLETPSSGLVYRAVLYNPPDHIKRDKIVVVKGKNGRKLSFLPAQGSLGDPRPISTSQMPNHPHYNFKTGLEFKQYLQDQFPQLEAAIRLSDESADIWCTSEGSTFPRARWCSRASAFVDGVGVALLGDALHSFPPDLGQGVNAGFCDVQCLLSLWPLEQDMVERHCLEKCFADYNKIQAPEAEAICKLLPIGMPYQYPTPVDVGRITWMSGFLCRLMGSKAFPSCITPPVVFQVTREPPKKYADILADHNANTRRGTLILLGCGLCLVGCLKLLRL